MINFLKNILNNQNSQENKDDNKNLELLCGLMIEAAYTDGKITFVNGNKSEGLWVDNKREGEHIFTNVLNEV